MLLISTWGNNLLVIINLEERCKLASLKAISSKLEMFVATLVLKYPMEHHQNLLAMILNDASPNMNIPYQSKVPLR